MRAGRCNLGRAGIVVFTLVILLDGEIEKIYVKQSEGIDNALEGIYRDFTPEAGTDGAT